MTAAAIEILGVQTMGTHQRFINAYQRLSKLFQRLIKAFSRSRIRVQRCASNLRKGTFMNPNQTAQRAVELGRKDGLAGKDICANPYAYTNRLGLSAWYEKGWHKGQQERAHRFAPADQSITEGQS
jgi:hypothetical protein